MFQQYTKIRCLVSGRGSSSLTTCLQLDIWMLRSTAISIQHVLSWTKCKLCIDLCVSNISHYIPVVFVFYCHLNLAML